MKLTVASFLSFHLVLFLNEVHRVFVLAADGSDYEDLDVEVAAKPANDAERAVKLIASFNSEMTELLTETGMAFADLPAGALKTFNTYLKQPIFVRRGKGGDADAVLGKVVPEGKEEQVFVVDANGVREVTNRGRRKMVIENTQTETIKLYWINPETRSEIFMQDISPQAKWEHKEVVVGHRYMVRSKVNALALIRVNEEDEQKHVITQSSKVTDKELEALAATAAAEDEDGDDAEEAEDDATADEEADEEEGDGEEGDDSEQEEGDDSEQEEGDDSEGDEDSADDEEDGQDEENDDDSEPADEEEAGDDSEEGDADEEVKEEL